MGNTTDDAYHITAPCADGEGAYLCMKLAIEDAGIRPEDVDYINAHGTSTPLNDKSETLVIKKAFWRTRLQAKNKLKQIHDRSSLGRCWICGGCGDGKEHTNGYNTTHHKSGESRPRVRP